MNVRFQISIASLGQASSEARVRMLRTVAAMGHLPLDLHESGVIDDNSAEVVRRHIERSDYLVLVIRGDDDVSPAEIEQMDKAYELAEHAGVPVLAILQDDSESDEQATGIADLAKRIRAGGKCICYTHEDVSDTAAWVLIRLIDTFPRDGWVSATELPQGDVATELARLVRQNDKLMRAVEASGPAGPDREEERLGDIEQTLRANKVLIPIWERTSSSWEKPVELSLYDFFVRLAPEMVVEASSTALSEFIPTGVCELDAAASSARWLVPLHQLNLWFTDLMALGLFIPSEGKRRPKDANHYWTLTEQGRSLISRARRQVLDEGGHRHVGMTAEHPIPNPMQHEWTREHRVVE